MEDAKKEIIYEFAGLCPVCKNRSIFKYMGLQKSKITNPIDLYLCQSPTKDIPPRICGANFSLETLINKIHAKPIKYF